MAWKMLSNEYYISSCRVVVIQIVDETMCFKICVNVRVCVKFELDSDCMHKKVYSFKLIIPF